MQRTILPPRPEELLSPLLASLPAASISPSPPTALLPILSPILRQRVQLLSSSSAEPWLPLLCYDAAKASTLEKLVKNERFEPHPVSGEVEIDWESEVEVRYRRIDEETMQALVSFKDLGLGVKLVWCTNDEVGGGDGWRIGEVVVLDSTAHYWGESSISLAEKTFETQPYPNNIQPLSTYNRTNGTNSLLTPEAEDEEDDADYWAQYDNTPARTPAPKHSPAPMSMSAALPNNLRVHADDEERYYAQYASVQPAMDDHDPDEAKQNGNIESSLGNGEITQELQQQQRRVSHDDYDSEIHDSTLAWTHEAPPYLNGHASITHPAQSDTPMADLPPSPSLSQPHPRPGSSTGSSRSDTVEKLEQRAAVREASEVGIKQHIGTSVKSLYRLARVAGIEREEFERLVRTELDCLTLLDADE